MGRARRPVVLQRQALRLEQSFAAQRRHPVLPRLSNGWTSRQTCHTRVGLALLLVAAHIRRRQTLRAGLRSVPALQACVSSQGYATATRSTSRPLGTCRVDLIAQLSRDAKTRKDSVTVYVDHHSDQCHLMPVDSTVSAEGSPAQDLLRLRSPVCRSLHACSLQTPRYSDRLDHRLSS